MVFQSKGELENEIEDTKDVIQNQRERILMFASSNPKDVISKDWKEEAIRFIHAEVSQLINELVQDEILLYKMGLLLESYDEQTTTEEDKSNDE